MIGFTRATALASFIAISIRRNDAPFLAEVAILAVFILKWWLAGIADRHIANALGEGTL